MHQAGPVLIETGSPFERDVLALLAGHLADLRATSPPGSVHALDPDALARPGIALLVARDAGGALLGCGAVKDLADGTGEVKSMRTAPATRGRGVGAAVLAALIDRARRSGWRRLSLETGTQPFFEPAVRLYLRHGFRPCPPFGSYEEDPSSRYLALALLPASDPGAGNTPSA